MGTSVVKSIDSEAEAGKNAETEEASWILPNVLKHNAHCFQLGNVLAASSLSCLDQLIHKQAKQLSQMYLSIERQPSMTVSPAV